MGRNSKTYIDDIYEVNDVSVDNKLYTIVLFTGHVNEEAINRLLDYLELRLEHTVLIDLTKSSVHPTINSFIGLFAAFNRIAKYIKRLETEMIVFLPKDEIAGMHSTVNALTEIFSRKKIKVFNDIDSATFLECIEDNTLLRSI